MSALKIGLSKLNYKWARVIFFITTTVFLIFFFPQGGKFKYEYQKGKPWMHQVLIAPFDFPVYKTDEDLRTERDSILKHYSPYFNYNPKVGIEQKVRFRQFFTNYWAFFNKRYPTVLNTEYRAQIELKVSSLFEFVYKRGIVELPDEFHTLARQNSAIEIVRDNVAEESGFDDIFTLKKAYEYIMHELTKYGDVLSGTAGFDPEPFFKGLDIEEYLLPNLYYDEKTSSKTKEEALRSVSLTEGMILTGERIIFTGDNVSLQAFKVLESLKKEYVQRMGISANYIFIVFGQAVLVIVILLLIFIFLNKFRKEYLQSLHKLSFILFIVLLFAMVASLTISFKPYGLYMIPFAIIPILLKTFFDTKLALFIHVVTTLLIGFWAPNGFEFVFFNITIGIVALLSLTNLYRRNKMFLTSAWIIATYSALYTGIALYQEGNFKELNVDDFLMFAGNGMLVLSSIPLIYIFEKLFGFLSDATLLELSDTNQPLLRKLAEMAPGTFQHSLQVANLSEEVVYKIKGNPLLVRTGALYHDIGKMENPMYFIENLQDQINPHAGLDYEKSVEVIVGHVTKGVEIAKAYNLPEPLVDFIRTHHGTSTVHYFYRSYLKKYPGTDVDINRFSYPGPKPFSREMAIVMMADSVEAASRSLKQYSERELNNLVDTIINTQLKDGQFNDADISLRDIETARSIFKKRLKNIYHSRIEYPKA